jgi:hypothetical protein
MVTSSHLPSAPGHRRWGVRLTKLAGPPAHLQFGTLEPSSILRSVSGMGDASAGALKRERALESSLHSSARLSAPSRYLRLANCLTPYRPGPRTTIRATHPTRESVQTCRRRGRTRCPGPLSETGGAERYRRRLPAPHPPPGPIGRTLCGGESGQIFPGWCRALRLNRGAETPGTPAGAHQRREGPWMPSRSCPSRCPAMCSLGHPSARARARQAARTRWADLSNVISNPPVPGGWRLAPLNSQGPSVSSVLTLNMGGVGFEFVSWMISNRGCASGKADSNSVPICARCSSFVYYHGGVGRFCWDRSPQSHATTNSTALIARRYQALCVGSIPTLASKPKWLSGMGLERRRCRSSSRSSSKTARAPPFRLYRFMCPTRG